MKTIFILTALMSAILAAGQPAEKPETKAPTASAAPTERALTESEVLKIRATMAEIKSLRQEYKISEFSEKVQPKSAEQRAVFVAACQSVGVPENKIDTECVFNSGLDENGNVLRTPDGKLVPAKVWWNKPAPATKP